MNIKTLLSAAALVLGMGFFAACTSKTAEPAQPAAIGVDSVMTVAADIVGDSI